MKSRNSRPGGASPPTPQISLSHHFIDIFCSQFSIFLCSIAAIYVIRLTAQLEIMDLDECNYLPEGRMCAADPFHTSGHIMRRSVSCFAGRDVQLFKDFSSSQSWSSEHWIYPQTYIKKGSLHTWLCIVGLIPSTRKLVSHLPGLRRKVRNAVRSLSSRIQQKCCLLTRSLDICTLEMLSNAHICNRGEQSGGDWPWHHSKVCVTKWNETRYLICVL